MAILNILAQHREYKSGVKHCTFNPAEPGVVRIHLIPPKFNLFRSSPYLAVLNGYYILPIGYSWAVLLSAFMDEVNKFDGKPISESDYEKIENAAVKRMITVYPSTSKKVIKKDLEYMTGILFDVARGESTNADIEKISVRSYSGRMTAPHRMELMVSAMTDNAGCWKCNQKCKFCYAAGQPLSNIDELGTQEWKTALDTLKNAGVPMVTFTGGEPTLREDLPELIDYARWFVTRLNTNGALLTPELCEKLRDASLDSAQITFYSYDKEIHNELTGSEHYDDTVQGIKNALECGLDVSVNTPLCKLNSDYVGTLSFLNSLGVRYVTVSGLICTGTAQGNHETYDLTEDELFVAVEKAKIFCDEHEMEIDFTSPGLVAKEKLETLGMNVPSCGAALSNMAVAPDGTVIPCQSWLGSGASLGNILTESFKKIWNNKKCVELRGMSDEEALCCPFRKVCERGE